MSTNTAIHLDALTHQYGEKIALRSVNLCVPEGSLFGFLGPNGAGKTTAIRVLLGMLYPTSGSATILGLNCSKDSARIKHEVGYLAGDLRLWPWLTGYSALSIVSKIRNREMTQRGEKLAQAFELDLKLPVRRMSKGTRQKLGLILSMAHQPKVLILDEASSGLDPLMQDRLRDMLRESARNGATVFFSSHTLSEVEDLCEEVAIVRRGQIVAQDKLEKLQSQAGYFIRLKLPKRQLLGPPPLGLEIDRQDHDLVTISGIVQDSLDVILASLQGLQPIDLEIRRPDLEQIFRAFYTQLDQPLATAGGAR
jgi:ABC-2 type transport system ATP-binding protein